jgi:hypothetical protein
MHTPFGPFERPETRDTLALWDADDESASSKPMQTPPGLSGFGPSVMVETSEGPQPVEWLRAGDLLLTRDSGYQPVVWVGRSTMNDDGALPPVRIYSGSLGGRIPEHDLIVSPNHKLLLNSPMVGLHFGEDEVLAPASDIATEAEVEFEIPYSNYAYCHVLLAQHEVILSEGVWIESLFPDQETLQFLGPDVTETIVSKLGPNHATSQTARMVLHSGEAIVVQPRNAVATRRMAA